MVWGKDAAAGIEVRDEAVGKPCDGLTKQVGHSTRSGTLAAGAQVQKRKNPASVACSIVIWWIRAHGRKESMHLPCHP